MQTRTKGETLCSVLNTIMTGFDHHLSPLYQFFVNSIQSTPLFLPASLTFLVAVIGSLVAIVTVKKNGHFARSKNAIDFEKNVEDSSEYRGYISDLLSFRQQTNDDVVAIKRLAADRSIDNEAYIAVQEVLNLWERCGNGVRCDVYSEKVLRRVYRGHLINLMAYLKPFIDESRVRKNNPYIYREMAWLARRWKRSRDVENFLRKITFRS